METVWLSLAFIALLLVVLAGWYWRKDSKIEAVVAPEPQQQTQRPKTCPRCKYTMGYAKEPCRQCRVYR